MIKKIKLLLLLSIIVYMNGVLYASQNDKGDDVDFLKDIIIEDQVTSFNEYNKRMKDEHKGSYDYYTSQNAVWNTPSGLKDKIADDGTLKPYFGNTLVFTLSKEEKEKIGKIQDRLRDKLKFLSAPLSQDGLHLTLHDLFHAKQMDQINEKIYKSRKVVIEKFKILADYLKKNPEKRFISMRPSMVLPSVNTSMVINYLPSTIEDYRLLFNIYGLFDEIIVLPYFLRSHITLDYFLPKNLSKAELYNLKEFLLDVNKHSLPVLKLDILELVYQVFSSMDEYKTLEQVRKN